MDERNVILEIRAGTGGDEAALFAGDLFRMYERYAATQGWKVEILSTSEGTKGGYKEIIAEIRGRGAYAKLKFESGVHRVQRVPDTEASGRIHTSAATVAVLPEVEDVDIDINETDLKIDTMRASGAGGQHVNKTELAIRITHMPSGIVVFVQEERSQHKNRAKAMAMLRAKLYDAEQTRRDAERAADRRGQVGSGDRSERIRTYNFPQGRVTDHRINLTLYKLPQVMEGEALDEVIDALVTEHQAALLAAEERGAVRLIPGLKAGASIAEALRLIAQYFRLHRHRSTGGGRAHPACARVASRPHPIGLAKRPRSGGARDQRDFDAGRAPLPARAGGAHRRRQGILEPRISRHAGCAGAAAGNRNAGRSRARRSSCAAACAMRSCAFSISAPAPALCYWRCSPNCPTPSASAPISAPLR